MTNRKGGSPPRLLSASVFPGEPFALVAATCPAIWDRAKVPAVIHPPQRHHAGLARGLRGDAALFLRGVGQSVERLQVRLKAQGRDRTARAQVAELIGAQPREIIFTSCATESNNTVIHAGVRANPDKRHIVTPAGSFRRC